MKFLEKVEIGNTGLKVTRLGLGGAFLANVGLSKAVAVVHRALELGVGYIDTAPLYGSSEVYIGEALSCMDREKYVISTKVGKRGGSVKVFDYSRDSIMRSMDESLKRLKIDRVDILFVHDPSSHPDGPEVGYRQVMDEAYPALIELRSHGVVRAFGAGMNEWEMPLRFAMNGDFDCFLMAGRYTLLDQSGLDELLPFCHRNGTGIIVGGPYNSGILASDLTESATYNYREAPPEILKKARRIKSVCDRYQVPLKAAALQFVLAHPAVTTVIPGVQSIPELEENIHLLEYPITKELWADLKEDGLLDKETPTP